MNKEVAAISPSQPKRIAGWVLMQRADDPDIDRANSQLKQDIANGATGVSLVFEGSGNAFGFGLPSKIETIEALFDGIDLDGLHIRLESHPHGRPLTDAFVSYLQNRRINPATTKLTFSTDYTAVLAATGKLKMSIEALKASLPQSMSGFFSSGIPGIVLEADGRPYHNAGATDAQELGAMLSVALAHLKMVEDGRHHIVYALPHIGFATALDQDPVRGIAKLRALRLLWRRLQEERNVPSPFAATIHVETSMRMMTRYDALANLPRTSLAAYAAITGGASSLSILPYNHANGLPDEDARRHALQVQTIMAHENTTALTKHPNRRSHDSDILAESAWEEFQRFEEEGGIMQSLIDGKLARRIEEARDLRIADLLKGERLLVSQLNGQSSTTTQWGLYKTKPSAFTADGILHCQPLTLHRDESDLAEARNNAPIETLKVI